MRASGPGFLQPWARVQRMRLKGCDVVFVDWYYKVELTQVVLALWHFLLVSVLAFLFFFHDDFILFPVLHDHAEE
jgi:hypothetical protein